MKKEKMFFGIALLVIAGLVIGLVATTISKSMHTGNMDSKRTEFISLKSSIQQELRAEQKYRCCLETPCTACIEKTPGHGEGATCDCLKDIVNGVHPCGECIGQILEGHGNQYLAEYFAKAIAEKVGEEHIDTLREIISEKYDISIKEQA